MRFIRPALTWTPVLLGLLVLASCNNAKLQELADKAKAAAAKGTESVKQQVSEQVGSATADVQESLQLAGDIKLTVDGPIETKACYARLISQGGARPKVFELRSYSSPDKESAPSVFFHAQIQAATFDQLAGQVVSGRLFVQTAADGPTWYSAAGSPVELKITETGDNRLTAEIVSATLQNTLTESGVDARGTFHAIQQ